MANEAVLFSTTSVINKKKITKQLGFNTSQHQTDGKNNQII